MNRGRILAAIVVPTLVGGLLSVGPVVQAAPDTRKIPVSGTDLVEKTALPRQPGSAKAARLATAGDTTQARCIGQTETLVLKLASLDPAHPGFQNVVFFRETPAGASGRARIWVAWDFLATTYSPPDQITCDQIALLHSEADSIIDTDVHYFGDYLPRGSGGQNVDILVYNIVDESYYDPDFPFYIAGYYDSQAQAEFDRNLFFQDSYAWDRQLGPDAEFSYTIEGTFAHELEHLIMHDHDPNELSWIDEGLAELAIFLNGFGHTSNTVYYLAFHRDSLTMWGSQLEDYGAAYLFELYLLENFGHKLADGSYGAAWTRNMVDQQADGIAGVEAQTGRSMQTLFDAWMLANLEDKPSRTAAGGLPMGYNEIDTNPYVDSFFGAWSIRRAIKDTYGANANGNLPISRYAGGSISGTVEFPLSEAPPYSAIYKSYGGQEPSMSVRLRGDEKSGVAPPEGTHEAFSGSGTLLTDRTLSLSTPVGGTLTFQTWYDLEEEWDYGFVEASTDGGQTWTKLPGSITRTSTNPNGSTSWTNALGSATSTDAAITGSSGGWVDASFHLPAAPNVLIRFNYYTDEAVNGRGWFVDQVRANGLSEGFESGAPGWDRGGWLVTTGLFDNDWSLAYVNPLRNGTHQVAYVPGEHPGDGYERFSTLVDTSRLGKGRVVVVFVNRPDVDDAFDAGFLLLVHKKY